MGGDEVLAVTPSDQLQDIANDSTGHLLHDYYCLYILLLDHSTTILSFYHLTAPPPSHLARVVSLSPASNLPYSYPSCRFTLLAASGHRIYRTIGIRLTKVYFFPTPFKTH